MSKRTVRLTESELKNIITESVKNIISELDWRTYASAAEKRRKQAYDERDAERKRSGLFWNDKAEQLSKKSSELDKAASRAMSKEYGRNLTTWLNPNGSRVVMDDGGWTEPSLAYGPEPLGYYYTSSKDRDWRKGWDEFQDGDFDDFGDIPFDRHPWETDDEYKRRESDVTIGKDVDNIVHDRMQYTKGKGWHLKDNK